MVVTTANNLEGYQIAAHLGVVRGIVVRSNNIISGFIGSFRTIFGGNIPQFERVCDDARQIAYDRMIDHAQKMGAHAVIAMRYDATEFSPGVTEVLAYGTAVQLKTS